jgi:hypothetical protein
MKKFTILLCRLALVFGIVGNAMAIDFQVDSSGSSVDLENVWGWGSLEADLTPTAKLFVLNQGDPTETIDFFTLTAKGSGGGYAKPDGLSGSGSGGALWGSIGFISGGILGWYSQPGSIPINDNVISIMFEQGVDIVCGT